MGWKSISVLVKHGGQRGGGWGHSCKTEYIEEAQFAILEREEYSPERCIELVQAVTRKREVQNCF